MGISATSPVTSIRHGSLSYGVRGLLPLVLAFAAPGNLTAQDDEMVSGEVACPACKIVLDTIVTISGLSGPGSHLIGDMSHVAVDNRGRLLVSALMSQEFAVFDPDGTFLQIVGRHGEGPGEYQMVSMVVAGPTYIHVFDPLSARRTVLDYSFEVVRVHPLPARISAVVTRNPDDLVLNADVGTQAAVGHRFHVLGPSGQMESFGGGDAAYSGRSPYRFALAGDGRNTLWAVRRDASIVTRWNLEPEPSVAKVFVRDLDRFEKDSPAKRRFPSSTYADAMLDQDGLWILWSTPDPEWTERQPIGATGTTMPDVPPRTLYDGWIDLLDPETGKTIARLQNDGLFHQVAKGSRYVVAYHETDGGVPFLHLLNPRLVRDLNPSAANSDAGEHSRPE